MAANDDLGALIATIINPMGRYQICLMLLIFLCRFPDLWHQVVMLIETPPPGNFTCSDPDLTECDPACPRHEFDHSVWEKTVIHEWDLVCEKRYIPSAIQSIVMSGILVGNVSCGYFADRFGRHGPLMLGVMLYLVAGVAAAFAPWLWLYITLRWLCTYGVGSTMICSFSILMEFTSRKYRSIVGILFTVPCILAHALLGLIGHSFRRWNDIQLVISVPSVVLLSYWWLVPESPRWLLTVGRVDPVVKILGRAAKCNKLPTDNIREKLEGYLVNNPPQDQKQGGNIVDLFRTKRMRTKSLVLMLCWVLTANTFFGILQYTGHIAGNIFLNIGLSGLVQLPVSIATCFLITTLGRKRCITMYYSMCISSLLTVTILYLFFPQIPEWGITIPSCISMMAIAGAFSVLYVYSGELYPTIIRTIGMGISSMSARIGCMVAPFVAEAKVAGNWIPPTLFAVFLGISLVLIVIFLPETNNTMLPNTVEDADEL